MHAYINTATNIHKKAPESGTHHELVVNQAISNRWPELCSFIEVRKKFQRYNTHLK